MRDRSSNTKRLSSSDYGDATAFSPASRRMCANGGVPPVHGAVLTATMVPDGRRRCRGRREWNRGEVVILSGSIWQGRFEGSLARPGVSWRRRTRHTAGPRVYPAVREPIDAILHGEIWPKLHFSLTTTGVAFVGVGSKSSSAFSFSLEGKPAVGNVTRTITVGSHGRGVTSSPSDWDAGKG